MKKSNIKGKVNSSTQGYITKSKRPGQKSLLHLILEPSVKPQPFAMKIATIKGKTTIWSTKNNGIVSKSNQKLFAGSR